MFFRWFASEFLNNWFIFNTNSKHSSCTQALSKALPSAMPSAGAIPPPLIIPLRSPGAAGHSHRIDTETYIELYTDNPYYRVYFSTDGTKPSPFQRRGTGKASTFRYKAPFSLKPGTRTIRAIAVSRDGIQESAVVSKTFTVEEVDFMDRTSELEIPVRTSYSRSKSASNKKKSRKPVSPPPLNDFEGNGVPRTGAVEDQVDLTKKPFQATNYSGTQINVFGVAPGDLSGLMADPNHADLTKMTNLKALEMQPAWPAQAQHQSATNQLTKSAPSQQALGMMAQQMMTKMENDRAMTVADIREVLREEFSPKVPALPAPPAPREDPLMQPVSPGGGNWRGQLQHVYAHLLDHVKGDSTIRSAVGTPKFGSVLKVELGCDADQNYVMGITLQRKDPRPVIKKKAKPIPKPVPKPIPEPLDEPVIEDIEEEEAAPPSPEEPEVPPEQKATKQDAPYFVSEPGIPQEGTLKPYPNFDAMQDAEKLRKAMKGLGTNEQAIIDVLGHRVAAQRVEIASTFKQAYGKDLKADLESELSGNFEDVCVALLLPLADYDATCLHNAISGLGTDEKCLIEIICTRTNAQIKAFTEAYKRLFNKPLEKDVRDDTSGYFGRLLVSLLQANRSEKTEYDETQVKKDVETLHTAGVKKWGTDESQFNMILCQRSYPHLRAVFREYEQQHKMTMEKVIDKEMSGDLKASMTTIVKCIKDKSAYFAEALYKAMKGLGTDDRTLQRIVISRCEIDMVQIKEKFSTFSPKEDLAKFISGDISGDYKKIILALIGA